MKQYPWKFKLKWNGVEWWQSEKTLGTDHYFYYFYWFDWIEKKENRFLGYEYMYYDGPIVSLCFWWVCMTWSTPWTKVRKEE